MKENLMNKYHIRFNKSRGQPGRGTIDHVWRVFENNETEYLARHVSINVPSWSEQTGPDWNITCIGFLTFYAGSDTVVIHNNNVQVNP
ncbi:MAG: hypothetical protein EBS24_08605 [Chitinophagia bacterium]|nr:hypothetical protein [Chitinophagia bacterium]